MTQVSDFVEAWIEENVGAEGYISEGDPRPRMFADQCFLAAAEQNISRAAIQAEYPDLVERMAVAMDRATDAEVRRLSEKND